MDSQTAEWSNQFQSVLCEQYELLSRCLVVSPELLMKLNSSGFLSKKVLRIRQQATADGQVAELLNALDEIPKSQQQSVYSTFISALRQGGQEHVANLFSQESDALPMSDDHYQLLFSQQSLVCQCLDAENGLLDELFKYQVLTRRDYCSVKNKTDHGEMSREVITILLHKPDAAFDKFISALVTTNQEHVASLLGYACREKLMLEKHRQLLINNKEHLGEFIDPTYALLNSLQAIGVLNQRDIDNVACKPSYTEMSIGLVQILLRKPNSSFDKFIEALNDTEQQHVVHILTGKGEPPLSHLRRLVLRKARKKLVSRVDTLHTSLLAELISSGVLTNADKQRLEAPKVNEDRTAELIDIIARKSHKAYDKFIQALKDSGHLQVAKVLEGLELKGLVNPHFLSDTEPTERNRIVQIIRNNMTAMLSGTGPGIDEITNVMEQNGFAVSEVAEGSIRISFRCFSVESLVNLKQLYDDKTLDKLFTKVFCREFAEQGLESLTLHIPDEEFGKLTENQMDEWSQVIDTQPMVNDLPVELLESVLMVAFIKLFIEQYKSHEAIKLGYSTLARVCYSWWQAMNGCPQSTTRHWFKHKLRPVLKYVCRPYIVSPRLVFSLPMRSVCGVTVCDNKLFIVCEWSNSILVFGPNNEQLANIKLQNRPRDIVSCNETQQLYVASGSYAYHCVWRVSLDGREVVNWLSSKPRKSSKFSVWTLSVTSRRLLVTSRDTKELLLLRADGVELKRVPLLNMTSVQHAAETSRGTFIVAHKYPQPRVCEINVAGHVMRFYCDRQQLSYPVYLSLDSDGRIFVADWNKHRILLLNSSLGLERVLLDRHQLAEGPRRLCYTEQTRQVVVACYASDCVQLFALID